MGKGLNPADQQRKLEKKKAIEKNKQNLSTSIPEATAVKYQNNEDRISNNEINKQELFVTDTEYDSLDQCIDDALMQSDELFSIVNLVRGQPPRKKTKTKDLKPIVFVRLT